MSRQPRNKIELDILHGINELRCRQEVLHIELNQIKEMIEALASGATEQIIDRINTITARVRLRQQDMQAIIDANQPPPQEPKA